VDSTWETMIIAANSWRANLMPDGIGLHPCL
jgi:hypothetical protein